MACFDEGTLFSLHLKTSVVLLQVRQCGCFSLGVEENPYTTDSVVWRVWIL